MKKYILVLGLAITGTLYISSISRSNSTSEVPYPEGYRTWTHVKTAVIGPSSSAYARFGGFHHIYANGKAMEGYQSGKFPEGAMLVFDVLEMVEEKNGNIVEGKRRFVDVMIRDKTKYDSTGGWGFEEFNGNSKSVRNILNLSKKQCFNCHSTRQEKDFVFTSFRE